MENTIYLVRALPVISVLILLEIAIYHVRSKRPYGWKESLSSFLVLFMGRPIVVANGILVGWASLWFYQLRLFDLAPTKIWHWIILFFAVEFFYYWFHRLNHRVRYFWASHSVHHSPNQFTLSVAYRLGWSAGLSGGWLFFMPLAVMGVPPQSYVLLIGTNLLYQFWLHTELIPKFGWLELFFNTPSQHRVHHAVNSKYLDRNFGGVICIYDRLFGTYQKEEEACHYGVLPPLNSVNPFKIALHGWISLGRDVYRAANWKERMNYLVRPPGWTPNP